MRLHDIGIGYGVIDLDHVQIIKQPPKGSTWFHVHLLGLAEPIQISVSSDDLAAFREQSKKESGEKPANKSAEAAEWLERIRLRYIELSVKRIAEIHERMLEAWGDKP